MRKQNQSDRNGKKKKQDAAITAPSAEHKEAAGAIAPTQTEVVILGTIHYPWNKRFLSADIERILLALEPAAILDELSPYAVKPGTDKIVRQFTKAGRLVYRKTLYKSERHSQEYPAIDHVSRHLGIRIYPIDIENLSLYFKENRPFERVGRIQAIIAKLAEYLEKRKDPRAVANRIALQSRYRILHDTDNVMRCATPDVLNSEGFDDLRRLWTYLYDNLLPAICAQYRGFVEKHYPRYDQFIEDHTTYTSFWHGREKTMADHIARIALDYPGKRLVVVVGGFHRAGLRDILANQNHIQLREFWEILPEEKWIAR